MKAPSLLFLAAVSLVPLAALCSRVRAESPPDPVATADRPTCLIEASRSLCGWRAPVVAEATGADAAAIRSALAPLAPGTGWSCHTFRIAGGRAAFIRAKVTGP